MLPPLKPIPIKDRLSILAAGEVQRPDPLEEAVGLAILNPDGNNCR